MDRKSCAALVVSLGLASGSTVLARGDGTFKAPLTITNAGRPGPTLVHSGDFNGDGKLDLVAANGSPSILVFFQSASSRLEWQSVPLRVGSQVWFARSADFDGDGFDDLVAADISSTAYFIRSRGDGTFERPAALRSSDGARWTAVGDWNRDGKMDVATANISGANLTIFLGDGQGGFTLSQNLPGSREHTLEALDYNGDGIMDLVLGTGLGGLSPHQGVGDGKFVPRDSFLHMGCVEYLAEVGYYQKGKYVLVGDLNHDGKGDLSPTCIETTTVSVGVSLGDGTYQETLQTAGGPDVDSTALGDLSGDGHPDLAVASKGWSSILVYLGKGDGYFQSEPLTFGPTGEMPSFLIVRDLDGDDRLDLISADQVSSTLTILWGRKGERFLESALTLTGHPAAKAMAVADLDRDGTPDLFLARADQPEVRVYLKPGLLQSAPLVIQTESKYTALEAVDLDGDGVPDVVGADQVSGNLLVALLNPAGTVKSQTALPAGLAPAGLKVGQLDLGPALDVAVPCKGSNHLALFLGQGGGAFGAARILPTVEKPKGVALARLDADAWTDLVVISDTAVAVHPGKGSGDFKEAVPLLQDASKLFTDVAVGDLNGDSLQDLVVCESKTLSLLLWKGRGDGGFEPPTTLKTQGSPGGVVLADLNGDALPDLVATNQSARSVSVFLNQGNLTFAAQLVYNLGIVPTAHRLLDLNGDGALDLVALTASSAVILFGRPEATPSPRFRRGDPGADGRMGIDDAILILSRLFLGGDLLPCEKAADADDDGLVMVNDPIVILSRLFLGWDPLPAPGSDACGEDPKQDDLLCAADCP